jgi:methanogenic corrinoid protein MtbC1
MAYTKKQILDMLDDRQITTAQASKMLLDLDVKALSKEEKKEKQPIDPMKALADELRAMAQSIEQSTTATGNVVTELNRIIGVMAETMEVLKAGKTLKVELPKGDKRPTAWNLEFKRDHRGLIESPIRLKAG